MSESNQPIHPNPPTVVVVDNPYNIDYEKERQLKKWFFILIAGGFLIAATLLIVAFILDSLNDKEIPAPTPPPTPPGFQTTMTIGAGEQPSAIEDLFARHLPIRGA